MRSSVFSILALLILVLFGMPSYPGAYPYGPPSYGPQGYYPSVPGYNPYGPPPPGYNPYGPPPPGYGQSPQGPYAPPPVTNVTVYQGGGSSFGSGSLMVSPGGMQGPITQVGSGYDPNNPMIPTGIPVGGGFPGMPTMGMGGMSMGGSWIGATMIAPPISQMLPVMNPYGGMGGMGGVGMGGMGSFPSFGSSFASGAFGGGFQADPLGLMMMSEMGPSVSGIPTMTPGMTDVLSVLQTQTSIGQKLQAQRSVGAYRIVRGLTNSVLANRSPKDLERYQKDLEDLVAVNPDELPQGVDIADIDVQMSRVNLALTDPSTLLLDPNASKLPDVGVRQERIARLNALLEKWITPDGLGEDLLLRKPASSRRSYSSRRLQGAYQSSTANMTVKELEGSIEKIAFDERQLNQAKGEAVRRKDEDTVQRINRSLYNMLIAKGKLFDNMMDSVADTDWEALIDNTRRIGPVTSSATASRPYRGRMGSSAHLASTSSLTTSSTTTAATAFQMNRDDIVALKADILGIIEGIKKYTDTERAQGSDNALVKTLEAHAQKVEKVLAAIDSPSTPNPFRTSQNALMQQIYTIYNTAHALSDKELYAQTPDILMDYKDKLDAALRDPESQLPPQLTYTQVQTFLDKILKILAMQVYAQENQNIQLTRGTVTRRIVIARGLGAQVTPIEELVKYLREGVFNRGATLSIDMRVSSDDVIQFVKQANNDAILNTSTAQKTIIAHQARRKKAESALSGLSNDNLDKIIQGDLSILSTIPTNRLQGIWLDLLDYYYNGDWNISPSEEQIKQATELGNTKTRTRTRSTGIGLKDVNEEENKEGVFEVKPEEKGAEKLLHDGVLLRELIGALEASIASEFTKEEISQESVRSNMTAAVTRLQEAYLIQYSGFMPKDPLEKMKNFTTTLVGLIDKVRSGT